MRALSAAIRVIGWIIVFLGGVLWLGGTRDLFTVLVTLAGVGLISGGRALRFQRIASTLDNIQRRRHT